MGAEGASVATVFESMGASIHGFSSTLKIFEINIWVFTFL